ncbi:hypothetical protein JCM4814A_52860 [Streptomyces phaeofaciens JCM 4814]|uniref:Uncharacterized protein n=1 Tax=Streptomyces phaeofaciens TaxID=68254 RepID=A0A918M297_9ACTN|nr:hypothetical protein GCM10010226_92180 [Streptomyces phaeofaciens]
MARDLLAQDSVDATLRRISESATELVEGCDAAGILVLSGVKVQTLAPTSQLVVDSDQLQERRNAWGEGPASTPPEQRAASGLLYRRPHRSPAAMARLHTQGP